MNNLKKNGIFNVTLGAEQTRGIGNKIFVGRLPQEASVDDLRDYFGRFGRIQDAYIPKVSYKFRERTLYEYVLNILFFFFCVNRIQREVDIEVSDSLPLLKTALRIV